MYVWLVIYVDNAMCICFILCMFICLYNKLRRKKEESNSMKRSKYKDV